MLAEFVEQKIKLLTCSNVSISVCKYSNSCNAVQLGECDGSDCSEFEALI